MDTQDVSRWFTLAAFYDLPVGKGRALALRSALAERLLGGWTVNGGLFLSTGVPIQVAGSWPNRSIYFNQRPDLVCDAAKDAPRTPERWFNPTCYAAPASAYVLGTAPRTLPNVRADGVHDVDFSVFKNFRLRETMNVQFRVEAFNLLNSVQYGIPAANWNPRDLSTFGRVTAAASSPPPVAVRHPLHLLTPMTPRQRVLAALHGERVLPVPAAPLTQPVSLSQMNTLGIRWPDAHRDAALMAGLADGARTLFGFDLVRVPFDQTIEAERLGAEVDFGGADANCSVRQHPLSPGVPVPPPPDLAHGRPRVVCDAIRILKARCGESAAVAGGVTGPFTLACQMLGDTAVLMDSLRRPETVRPYLEFAVSVSAAYARLQVQAGADVICVEDMSASLDLTSPGIYRRLILDAQRQLVRAIGATVVLHVCGRNTAILDLLAQSGAAALSLEDRTDLAAAVRCGCAVAGGVPPLGALLNGSPEDVRRSSLASLRAGVHMLAPGCGVPLETPDENLRALAAAAEEWRA